MAMILRKRQYRFNLASRMESGKVKNIQDLKTILDKYNVNVNIRNRYGESPLMIACEKGDKKMVRYLLHHGASPNARSKNGNTPMHFAVLQQKGFLGFCGCFRGEGCGFGRILYSGDDKNRHAIIRLLIKHGATVRCNSSGFSPPCLAAIHQCARLVKFFVLKNVHRTDLQLSDAEKIRAYEILGVSLVLGTGYSFKASELKDFDPYALLSKALTIRKKSGQASIRARVRGKSLAAKFFSLFSTKECMLKELKLKSDWAFQVQCFLVAEKVLPKDFKDEYLLPRVLDFGYSCLFNWDGDEDQFSLGSQILREAMKLEEQSLLQLGSVLHKIFKVFYEDHEPWPNSIAEREWHEIVDRCLRMFGEVPAYRLYLPFDWHPLEELGAVLFSVAYNIHKCISMEAFEALIQFGEKLIRVFQKRCKVDVPSVTHSILFHLDKLYFDDDSSLDEIYTREIRLYYVICRIVRLEDASGTVYGSTMLHALIEGVAFTDDLPFIKDTAEILVRHGCNVEARDQDGRTAKEILSDKNFPNLIRPLHAELFEILSTPSSVLRLEELAGRAILRHKVPFEAVLPRHLCAVVRGEREVDSELMGFRSDRDSNLELGISDEWS